MKKNIFYILMLVVFVLSACAPSNSEPTTDLDQQAQEIVDTAKVQIDKMLAGTPDCKLTDGREVFFSAEPESDGLYHLSSGMKELKEFKGCPVVVEGRLNDDKRHDIWVFNGNEDWSLKVMEGTPWAYPYDWNMTDFSTEKPPIATEFVVAKRNNQRDEKYDWPIYLHIGDTTYIYPAGSMMPKVQLPDNASNSTPKPINIHGTAFGNGFNASIGAEGTYTVAIIDGTLFYWKNAQDNIFYSEVEAYTVPSDWTVAQLKSWSVGKFGKEPTLLK